MTCSLLIIKRLPTRNSDILAGDTKSDDNRAVINVLAHRCFIVLSMLAMLGIVAAVPVGSAFAADKAGTAMTDHADAEMPCHKPVKSKKPCPDCPQQQTCPEGAACMVKCFQQLSAVLVKSLIIAMPLTTAGILLPDAAPAGAFPAPPLRPPIV